MLINQSAFKFEYFNVINLVAGQLRAKIFVFKFDASTETERTERKAVNNLRLKKPMRAYDSYVTLAAVVNGLASKELIAALRILYCITHKKTILFKSSLVAIVLIFLVLATNLIALDYIASPYEAPSSYLGILFLTAYVLNFLSSILITFLFMIRIKIFYGGKSTFFKAMSVLGLIVVLIKGSADFIGIKISYDYATGASDSPVNDPHYWLVPFIMAFGSTFEAVFSAIGSLSFLYYLTDFDAGSTWSDLRQSVFKQEGVRLFLIICIHLAIVVCAIVTAISETWLSHLGFFLPSLAYSVELRTFLELSYQSAPNIIKQFETNLSSAGSRQYSSGINLDTGTERVSLQAKIIPPPSPISETRRDRPPRTTFEMKADRRERPLSPIPENRSMDIRFPPPKPHDSIDVARVRQGRQWGDGHLVVPRRTHYQDPPRENLVQRSASPKYF